MAKMTKTTSASVVDKTTNRSVHFRYQVKRVRDPETGEKTETTELAAVTQFDVAEDGRKEVESDVVYVDDVLTAEQRANANLDELLDIFHNAATARHGYV